MALFHANEASQEIACRNVGEAREALVKAGAGVARHMKEIASLLERYSAVEKFYEAQDERLSTKINDVHSREQSAQSKKSAAEYSLQLQKSELSRHESNLDVARHNYEKADKKRKDNNAGTITTGVLAGVAGVAAFFTFGATAPLAAAAVAGAVAFDKAADEAKDRMKMCEREMDSTRDKIRSTESTISSLSSTISQLQSEEQCYREERQCLQEEKGRIKKVRVFLMDAQVYGENYKIVMKTASDRTAMVKKVVDNAEKRGYSLFDSQGTERQLSSFEDAWAAFEEMNEKGETYVFKVEFSCSRCNCGRNEFPQVSFGQLVCASCY